MIKNIKSLNKLFIVSGLTFSTVICSNVLLPLIANIAFPNLLGKNYINTAQAQQIILVQKHLGLSNYKKPNIYAQKNDSQSNNRFDLDKSFVLRVGESVKVYTTVTRGLVKGLKLSIHNFRSDKNRQRVEQIIINEFQEYPFDKQVETKCQHIFVSKSSDYTLTPITNQSKNSGHRVSICSHRNLEPRIILELHEVTDNGEATVILKKSENYVQ